LEEKSIERINKMFYWLLCENSALARLVRTTLQGVAGVLVAAMPQAQTAAKELLMVFGLQEFAAIILVPFVMALLAPLMAKLGDFSQLPSLKNCVVCDAEGNELSLEQALAECPEQPNYEECIEGDSNG
jgi:hypothetical protein